MVLNVTINYKQPVNPMITCSSGSPASLQTHGQPCGHPVPRRSPVCSRELGHTGCQVNIFWMDECMNNWISKWMNNQSRIRKRTTKYFQEPGRDIRNTTGAGPETRLSGSKTGLFPLPARWLGASIFRSFCLDFLLYVVVDGTQLLCSFIISASILL